MRVVIGGASGFLGGALSRELRNSGHQVISLVRRQAIAGDESQWDPAAGIVDGEVIASADAVINLSGSPIQQWPRTASQRAKILQSRVSATSTLARAIAESDAPAAFLSGSGMSWYGTDRGNTELIETASSGDGFLAEVSQQWEAATVPAAEAGAAVTWLRTSVVLDASGGALKLMKIPFSLGLGARLGSGKQWFSVISRRDWVGAVKHVLEHRVTGPVNLAIPTPATNADFTRALAAELHRPAVLAAPEFALRAVLGGLADDLFGSLKILPGTLVETGYEFADPDVRSALASALLT